MNSAAKTLYYQVAESIRQSIVAGNYHDRLPNEADLAKRFEVSVPTLKRALSVLAEDGVIRRIPGKGTFINTAHHGKSNPEESIEASSNNPISGERGSLVIGVILPQISDAFASGLLTGISEGLNDCDAQLLLGVSHDQQAVETAIMKQFLKAKVDGLIVFPVEGELYNEDIVRLSLERFPLVLIDRWLPGIDVSRVVGSHAVGVHKAVSYLFGLGHRDIGLVSVSSEYPRSTQSLTERQHGFLHALKDHGINPDERWLWINDAPRERNRNQAIEFVITMIQQNPTATALIGLSVSDTLVILEAMRQMGKTVPDDVSVMGFDMGSVVRGLEILFHDEGGNAIPVAWIDQSEKTIGREAALLACRLISTPGRTEVVEVPSEVHAGRTCASPSPAGNLCH